MGPTWDSLIASATCWRRRCHGARLRRRPKRRKKRRIRRMPPRTAKSQRMSPKRMPRKKRRKKRKRRWWTLRKSSRRNARSPRLALQQSTTLKCVERVTGAHEHSSDKKHPDEDCVEEFFHLAHCASACAAPKLWASLK